MELALRLRRLAWAATLALPLASACSGGGSGSDPLVTPVQVTVHANVVTGTLSPLWSDHYDLSVAHVDYWSEPGMLALAQSLAPRSWRCSVGRWEIGFTPPPGGDSTDPNVLKGIEREFYRGPNTLAGADDPANYDFAYLDHQLTEVELTGAEPYLCFDYVPFTLSSEQDPLNAANLGLADPTLSFSNGIRTAPPADPAVYARVVRNVVRHVRGLFAGASDFGVGRVEIGNEPDLADPAGLPLKIFWTGTRAQWIAMYAAIAAEIAGDAQLAGVVALGGGSFAFSPVEPDPTFAEDFLADVATQARRLDFVSYHCYADDPVVHLLVPLRLRALLQTYALTPEVVNAEWGRALDGADPVYDTIEHGLFRAKAIAAMEALDVSVAHESLFRDPQPGADELGLVFTGPPRPKPASDVYRALAKLDVTPDALMVAVTSGTYALAGRDSGSTKVVVVFAGDDPGAGHVAELTFDVIQLPWGAATFDVQRFEVSQATWSAGQGVKLVASSTGLAGGAYHEVLSIAHGASRLIVWELTKDP